MVRINLTSLALAASLMFTGASAMAGGWNGGHNGGWNGGHNGGWNGGHDDHHNDHHDDHHNDNHDSHGDKWYSDYYHQWFDKSGYCGQYNYKDYDTCNSGRDYMQCDWDSSSRTCYESHH